ncbi:MAG: EAL domain-containing protein [Pelosinus sp.]|nr:EAL domain-containing protein [Pelosinus sp.]
MFTSLRKQLTWIIGLLILFALCATLFISYTLISEDYEKKMQYNNSVLAESLASNITQFMQNAYNISGILASYPDLMQIEPEKQQGILVDAVRQYPIFQLLAINNLDGMQIARSSGPLGNRAERFWFKKFMAEQRPYISKTYYSVSTDFPINTILHGIYSKNKMVGVFMADIETPRLQEMVEKYNLGAGSYAYLLDGEGAVIAHPDKKQVAEVYNYKTLKKQVLARDSSGNTLKNRDNNEIIEESYFEIPASLQNIITKVMAGEVGVGQYTDFNGEKYICAYRAIPLPGSSEPWSLIVVQRKSAVMAFMGDVTIKTILVGLFVILLSALLVILFSRKITRPLLEVVDATNRVKNGDLTIQLAVKSTNEIGALAANFNQMVSELHEHREHLEELVESRTVELGAANQELRVINETLHEENHTRRLVEEKLLLRERQYRAITGLLTQSSGAGATEDIFKATLYNAVELLGAVSGYIGLFENDGKEYRIRYSIGIDPARLLEEKPAQEGMQGHVYATKEIFYIEDYRVYPQRISSPWIGSSATTVIMVPLKNAAAVNGILAVNWVDEVHQVTKQDLDALRQFADLASVALERDNIQKQIFKVAYYDEVTGLPNRANLSRYLESEMEKVRAGCAAGIVLFVDIDDLKSVNDNFGHYCGDDVIIAAGKMIIAAAGEGAFVSRQGGDEFIVVVPGVDNSGWAAEIADNVVKALCQEYKVADESLSLSASVGVAVYPEDGDRAEELMKKADIAMYAAKKAGKNCWRFYEPILSQEGFEKMMLTNSLRRGLERSEFSLQYQPQFTANGDDIIGFEALLRWNSAEHGFVSPTRFIPLAEHSGLILPIGQWVIEEACKFVRRLTDLGRKNIYVAVNISPRQLRSEDFVAKVRTSIENAGVLPYQIEFEITESVLIEAMEESVSKLCQLRELGVKLSLDDFGTGYSSLTYLKNLPVNILKIDKSFIDKISDDKTQLKLVGSIIDLGHTLGLYIIAEGVETEAQRRILATIGCDYIQGYIFSKPLPEEAAVSLLIG